MPRDKPFQNQIPTSSTATPGPHTHAAGDTTSAVFALARLGSGTPAAGKYVDGGTGAWTTLPGAGGTGDVIGPAGATSNDLCAFDTATGKLIKDSGIATSAVLTLTGSQTVTNKDLTSGTNTFPVFNQNTTGSAATLTTSRTIGTLTGDVTSAGSGFNGSAANTNATVLATVNPNVGTFGGVDQALGITFDGKGRATAVGQALIAIAQSQVANLTTDLAAKAPLASPAFTGTPTGITKTHVGLGNVDNTADASKAVLSATKWATARTIALTGDVTYSQSVDGSANVTGAATLAASGVSAGTYASATTVPQITVDAKGRITAASSLLIQLSGGAIVSGTVAPARLGSGTASSSTVLRGDSTWGPAPTVGSTTLVVSCLWNDTTDPYSDPGSGYVMFGDDNAMAVSELDTLGTDHSTFFAALTAYLGGSGVGAVQVVGPSGTGAGRIIGSDPDGGAFRTFYIDSFFNLAFTFDDPVFVTFSF